MWVVVLYSCRLGMVDVGVGFIQLLGGDGWWGLWIYTAVGWGWLVGVVDFYSCGIGMVEGET